MIQKLVLTLPIRIQLRLDGKHEVDPDWWQVGDHSESEKAEIRDSWQNYTENRYGKIVHSVAVDDTVQIYEGNTISAFYVRSIENNRDYYVVRYGRMNALGGDIVLPINLKRIWVKEVHEN